MKKPGKYHPPAAYKYHDIIDFIEDKYKIRTRGYKEDKDKIYRDFWHWVVDMNGLLRRQGCYAAILCEDTDYDQVIREEDYLGKKEFNKLPAPPWVVEILQLIRKEFPDIGFGNSVWVEW